MSEAQNLNNDKIEAQDTLGSVVLAFNAGARWWPSLFFTGVTWPESETKILSIFKSDFQMFQSPELREKDSKLSDSYMWFSLCSQTYRKMVKAFVHYFWFIARFG
jgi:hypothetical protein